MALRHLDVGRLRSAQTEDLARPFIVAVTERDGLVRNPGTCPPTARREMTPVPLADRRLVESLAPGAWPPSSVRIGRRTNGAGPRRLRFAGLRQFPTIPLYGRKPELGQFARHAFDRSAH